jgi:membrane-associated HD superfamily phosphohydrolase
VQKKILKAADDQIKKTLTTSPAPIQSKVDFFQQVQELKGQHHQHQKEVINHHQNEIKQVEKTIQKKILKAADDSIKKTLTTAPPPI